MKTKRKSIRSLLLIAPVLALTGAAPAEPQIAQTPPNSATAAGYRGLFAAVANIDIETIEGIIRTGRGGNIRDGHGRTPLKVAAHRGDHAVALVPISAGAEFDALDQDRYDMITVAGVRGDLKIVQLARDAGANPGQMTSPYDGTALIALAPFGHVEVVRALIKAIVLGDGRPRHTQIAADLVAAGANINLTDGNGASPLRLARSRGYDAISAILIKAGAK